MDPMKVESILTNIFRITSRWKAILFLDEADIFIAERTDLSQNNALVSVFLRELEQYDSILFLTTNRLKTFDSAIISRIHVAMKYPELNNDTRKSVWRYFIERAETKYGKPACSEKMLAELSKMEMNGREVRKIILMTRCDC